MARQPLPRKDVLSVGALILPTYTVATLPANHETGAIVYCSNGNAGQESLVIWNGSNWIAIGAGATAATS